MLWQINLFEMEWMNGRRSRFVGTFAYEMEIAPWQKHQERGILVIRSHVMTWDNPEEEFREDRFREAIVAMDLKGKCPDTRPASKHARGRHEVC